MITTAILILIVAKALPGLNTHIFSIHVTRITSIVFLFASALSFNCLKFESLGSSGGIGIFSGFYQITIISQIVEIFLFIIGGGILIAWPQIKVHAENNLFKNEAVANEGNKKGTDYSLIVLFSSLGSSLLISSYDLISLYLSIELQSFGLYVLSTLYKDKESSTSAGLKYFLLGGLSSCILLLGTGIIYSYTGTTSLESIYIINSVIDIKLQYIIQGTSLGLSLIFIGFLFKIAAAPLHNWSPDVYDGTPTIVTTWLTIIPKIAILFILLELQVKLGSFSLIGSLPLDFKTIFINNSGNFISIFSLDACLPPNGAAFSSCGATQVIFLISSFLSLIIGSLLGLAQKKIKRLLAYSTISHLGFILLALSINTEQSIDSFIFYIIQYTITNLNIFLIILGLTYYFYSNNLVSVENLTFNLELKLKNLNLFKDQTKVDASLPFSAQAEQAYFDLYKKGSRSSRRKRNIELDASLEKDISFISELKGLFFKNPLLSFSLIVSLFSMAGIPPLIGFFSKQLVLYSALQNGYYFLSLVAIIVSVISCSYYLQIVKVLITNLSVSELPYPSFGLNKLGRASVDKGHPDKPKLTNTHSYLIAILTLTNLFFFIKPSLILNSTQLLSLSLFYI
jgi:NADH-ubiquinone oxidoreductase chain 2